MLVLGLDTASPTTSVAVVQCADTIDAGAIETATHATSEHQVRSVVDIADSRRPAEQLAPAIERALAQAGVATTQIDLIAVGVGPGPFTGLRAGLVTARVLGGVLGRPVVGVVSQDALAFAAAGSLPAALAAGFVVATDARRREVYWARYAAGARILGPSVSPPGDVDTGGLPVLGRGAVLYPDVFGAPSADLLDPPAWAVAVLGARAHLAGDPLPPDPLYLRRPDVAEAAPRKRVLAR